MSSSIQKSSTMPPLTSFFTANSSQMRGPSRKLTTKMGSAVRQTLGSLFIPPLTLQKHFGSRETSSQFQTYWVLTVPTSYALSLKVVLWPFLGLHHQTTIASIRPPMQPSWERHGTSQGSTIPVSQQSCLCMIDGLIRTVISEPTSGQPTES